MANNTEVIFEDIEQRIIKEIESAHYAIFVSVAWFTNKKLFNALLEKAKSNCYVSIIIQLDEINSQSGIDYSQIEIGRSECFKISKDAELLHDKFCVIDFKKVITGSYNWTYKASHNSENILILDDPTVATQYISRFEQQKSKFTALAIQDKSFDTNVSRNMSKSEEEISIIEVNESQIVAPTIKQCSHCLNHINYNYLFCPHCGRQQDEFFNIERIRKCKKCNHVQREPLLDVNKTHYCTSCGSHFLELHLTDLQLMDSKKICPICKKHLDDKDYYCPSCGLKREVYADTALQYRDDKNDLSYPLKARHEFSTYTEYQLCPKCHLPNYFGENYCRNCGENITLHAEDKKRYGWVDLGLSVLWSTETMEGFYPWMDSKNKLHALSKYLDWDFVNDGKDVASIKWGDKWRTPTKEEFEELIDKCKWEKMVIPNSNKNAIKIIGPNGNYIILPVTGYAGCEREGVFEDDPYLDTCSYWTSTRNDNMTAFSFHYIGYIASHMYLGTFISKVDQKKSNELWLNTPIDKKKMQILSIGETLISHGRAIRPVADKKWQGYL